MEPMPFLFLGSKNKLELVYLPKGKYCVYPRMAYRLAIVMPPPPPFWTTKNHFRLHFSPFQINAQLTFFLNFVQKIPAAILDERKSLLITFFLNSQNGCILDDRKSHSITFLTISDQYANFFSHKMAICNNLYFF